MEHNATNNQFKGKCSDQSTFSLAAASVPHSHRAVYSQAGQYRPGVGNPGPGEPQGVLAFVVTQ